MKNQVQQFYNKEFGNLEVLMISGKPYFPATECAKVLGYKNPHKTINDHCPHLTKREVGVQTGVKADGSPAFQRVAKSYIPEGDLYRLIIRSKLPAAVRFEAWVCDEILPSVRKYGAYAAPEILDEMIENPKFAEELMRKLDAERRKSSALAAITDELIPKVIYCDLILQTENVIPVSVIAKDYGMSARTFNGLLHALGIQYRVGETWVLYQPYPDKGYTKTRTYIVNERKSTIHTYWTQKGCLFLYEKLKDFGIVPVVEREIMMEGCA